MPLWWYTAGWTEPYDISDNPPDWILCKLVESSETIRWRRVVARYTRRDKFSSKYITTLYVWLSPLCITWAILWMTESLSLAEVEESSSSSSWERRAFRCGATTELWGGEKSTEPHSLNNSRSEQKCQVVVRYSRADGQGIIQKREYK